MIREGRCWVFGDNITGDGQIIPVKFVRELIFDRDILAPHCLEAMDPEFASKCRSGDFIVAGKNFGRGNFHPQSHLAIIGLGLAVVAESIPRGFWRMGLSLGLPMVVCPGITKDASNGDVIRVDFSKGTITNVRNGAVAAGEKIPDELLAIVSAGGVLNYLAQEAAGNASSAG